METIDFLKPILVTGASNNVSNLECLFTNDFKNNLICPKEYCLIAGKGYIVLDFGKEFFGGLRISFGNNKNTSGTPFLRIRFGESLMEANSEIGEKGSSNDHSTRDMTVYMSSHSDMTWGSTGFRFVRLDFLEDADYQIENIYLAFMHEDKPQLFFDSSSDRLNSIMDAAIRTLWLNKHNGAYFEGAKRDQHIWAGDLYPELSAALYSYASHENVKNSIDFIIDNYPYPVLYNGIPSYNVWFILTILRYFELTGDISKKYNKCICDNLNMLRNLVKNGFNINDAKESWGLTFLDWSTWGKDSRLYGIRFLIIYVLNKVIECTHVNDSCKSLASSILKDIDVSSFSITDSKPVNALALLSGQPNKMNLINNLKENGCKGYSCFLSYIILEALSQNNELEFAYQSMLDYFGGMIDIGGTTLFEEFDISWLDDSCKLNEKPSNGQHDFHGDFGYECFDGYRKSLCHGWSCGIIPFVIENIVGITIKNGNIICLKPNLLDLSFIECEIPTSKGLIKIKINENCREINAPEGFVVENN